MIDRIQVQELYNEISVDHSLQVIDTRDQDEFAQGHVPGALNNPLKRIQYAPNFVPEDHPIILYGADDSDGASEVEKTAQLLQERGFNVRILSGGIQAWNEAGLPLETEQH